MEKSKFRTLLELLLVFMKIGLFTFGGGYAMIPLIQREASEKRNWINSTEMLDILAISESTPGPVSINAATFIGYRVSGIWGAIFATLGLIFPSWLIILIISIFYTQIRSVPVIDAMFKGLKAGVIVILILTIIKLFKVIKWNKVSIILFLITLIGYLTLTFFTVEIPALSLIFITLGIITGLVVTKLEIKKGEDK